ncbi:hypothetical protein VFPPC_14290 [Pochonia chlamydosporia 170]|uniref:Microbial-type PARG catalytic domain-containing protein n=1 Tax=Pochonia chlamydosporia 170 TaxID=1380566 RepID=A0A179FKH9_METCM|nr:hypothetical protein VFPPC_14290 [Pochonia chlamydosporia 170]OAQ66136.1 hypothetical protein VFPPC_14290 [Pochonia chlamydosporia 170]
MSATQDDKMTVPPRIARAKRDARAKSAKEFINRTLPSILKSNARARRGVEAASLIIDPKPTPEQITSEHTNQKNAGPEVSPALRITLRVSDTLEAASRLTGHSSRVAILNMASPLRPGGGVLTGATSQEEQLCARTTLYASLREDFYRLPDVGGVYTPDVLVVRGWDGQMSELPVSKRFFVDVVTAAMLRMPDVEGGVYAEDKDREVVVRKMRAVMRMARERGVGGLVLGAWGCGAYGNPVGEIARSWRRVLLGRKGRDNGEGWDGLEVVFAVKDRRMVEVFADEFGDGLVVVEDGGDDGIGEDESGEDLDDILGVGSHKESI